MLSRVSIAVLLFLTVFSTVLAQQQLSATSSIDWQFNKIRQNLVSYENRVKSLASLIITTVNSLMDELKPNANVYNTYQTLSTISSLLDDIASINEYSRNRAAVLCSKIDERMGNIGSDNQRLAQIRGSIGINAGLVDTYSAVLYGAVYSNFHQLTTQLRFRGLSIRNRMNILTASLRQYENLLLYSINYVNVLYGKWASASENTCSDCDVFSGQSRQPLAAIDETVQRNQIVVGRREELINEFAIEASSLMKVIIDDIQDVSVLFDLVVSLDSCFHLVIGLRNHSTTDMYNETSFCADKTWRSSVINYKRFQYGVANNEAQYNITLLTSYAALVSAHFYASSSLLTSNQKSTISNIVSKLNHIADGFQKYILDLGLSYSALVTAESQVLANNAIQPCDCRAYTTTVASTFAPLSTTSSSMSKPTTLSSTTLRTTSLTSTLTSEVTTTTEETEPTTEETTIETTQESTTEELTTTEEATETTTEEPKTTSTRTRFIESTPRPTSTATTSKISTTVGETTTSTDYGTYPDTDYTEPVAGKKSIAPIYRF